MSVFTQKWSVAAFFENPEAGFEFPREETPLHATIAGVFAIDLSGKEIAELIRPFIESRTAFTVIGQQFEQWGDVKVARMKDSAAFDTLFMDIQDVLLKSGAVFNEPQYLHEGFTPHVTVQRSGKLMPEQEVAIQSVSVVDMFPGSNPYRRKIVKTIRLKQHE